MMFVYGLLCLSLLSLPKVNGVVTPVPWSTLTTLCGDHCQNGPCIIYPQNPGNCVSNNLCIADGKMYVQCLNNYVELPLRNSWKIVQGDLNTTNAIGPFLSIGKVVLPPEINSITIEGSTDALAPEIRYVDDDFINSINVGNSKSKSNRLQMINLNMPFSYLNAALPSLSTIILRNCSLQIYPGILNNQTKLTTLDLSYNPLLNITTLPIDVLNNVLSLNLSGSSFQSIPSFIFQMPRLNALYLMNTSIQNVQLTTTEYSKLQRLSMFRQNFESTNSCVPPYQEQELGTSKVCVGPDTSQSNSSSNSVVPLPLPLPRPVPNPSRTPQESNHTTLIIIITIVSVGALLFIGIYCYRRSKSRTQLLKSATELQGTPLIPEKEGTYSSPHQSLLSPDYDFHATNFLVNTLEEGVLSFQRLPYHEVYFHHLVSKSSSQMYEVWVGEYAEKHVIIQTISNSNNTDDNTSTTTTTTNNNIVPSSDMNTLKREFIHQMEVMVELKHPRLTTFLGIAWNTTSTSQLSVHGVVEYMNHLDLNTYFKLNTIQHSMEKVQIMKQITSGLQYLHSKDRVHGRLSGKNIVMDTEKGCKLSILAIVDNEYIPILAKYSNNTATTCTSTTLSTKFYVAPEVLHGERITKASDMYSLGVVLVQVDTGDVPLDNIRKYITKTNSVLKPNKETPTSTTKVGKKVEEEIEEGDDEAEDKETLLALRSKFQFPTHCPRVFKEIAKKCLHENSLERPTIDEIVQFINNAIKKK